MPDEIQQAGEQLINATQSMGAATVVAVIVAVIALAGMLFFGLGLYMLAKPFVDTLRDALRRLSDSNDKIARVMDSSEMQQAAQVTAMERQTNALAAIAATLSELHTVAQATSSEVSALDKDLYESFRSLREHVAKLANDSVDRIIAEIEALRTDMKRRTEETPAAVNVTIEETP